MDIIDRIESILSLEWFLALFVQIIMGLYFIKEGLKEIFKIKEKTNNTISIVTCLIIIILTQIIFKTAGSSNAYFKNELIYDGELDIDRDLKNLCIRICNGYDV